MVTADHDQNHGHANSRESDCDCEKDPCRVRQQRNFYLWFGPNHLYPVLGSVRLSKQVRNKRTHCQVGDYMSMECSPVNLSGLGWEKQSDHERLHKAGCLWLLHHLYPRCQSLDLVVANLVCRRLWRGMIVEQGVSPYHDRDHGHGPMCHRSVGSRLYLEWLWKIENRSLENLLWVHGEEDDPMMGQGLRLLDKKSLTSYTWQRVCDRIEEAESVRDCWSWGTSRTWIMSAALTEKQGKLALCRDKVVARMTSRGKDDSAPFQPRSWLLELGAIEVVFFQGERGGKRLALRVLARTLCPESQATSTGQRKRC
jgi:hypothetical protein